MIEVGLYHNIMLCLCEHHHMCYAGEFGVVYKAHLEKLGQSTPEIVAVKTLKG